MARDRPPDRLELRGLRVLGRHGVLPEEHTRAQPFEVDLDVVFDARPAGASDALGDTLDYGALTDRVAAVVAGPHAELLEHLAEQVAAAVLEQPRAVATRVTVRKVRPPVPHDLASAAVTVRRAVPPVLDAYLALGSNLGDRRAHLRAGVAGLPDVTAVSGVYETDPVGGPADQGPYLNCVVALRTARAARELLDAAHAAEAAAGRVRAERWGPRPLDVDVLLVGDRAIHEPDLIVPHPRLWERGFVLVPLADVAPHLAAPHLAAHPELGRGVRPADSL